MIDADGDISLPNLNFPEDKLANVIIIDKLSCINNLFHGYKKYKQIPIAQKKMKNSIGLDSDLHLPFNSHLA